MSEGIRHFWSEEIEDKFNAAYQAVMQHWPVPYTDLFISTSFGLTHVVASGPLEAFPVVLLNPGGGSAAIWINNVEALSQNFRVYAVDVVGEMNMSVPTRTMRNRGDFTAWMKDLFEGLGIQKTNLIGNSNGGFFAIETALNLSERVEKVVLISPAATLVQMWAFWLRLLVPAHMLAPMLKSEGMVQRAYAWLWQDFPKSPEYSELKSISIVAGYPRYRPSLNSFRPAVISKKELQSVQAPVLLLIGDHEVIYKPEAAIKRARRWIPNIEAAIVPNGNHSSQYTAPEFVNSKIVEFLSSKEKRANRLEEEQA